MITFQNIPTTYRTPGAYTEVDNSRALKGLVQQPHKVLILAQKEAAGTASKEKVYPIPNEVIADGYFGQGSILARMVRAFKANNPNTDLYAMALSETGTAAASGMLSFAGSATKNGTLWLMIGGVPVTVQVTSGWSTTDVASAVVAVVSSNPQYMCVTASLTTSRVLFKAIGSGAIGNYYDIRTNYYDGQSDPPGLSVYLTALAGGSGQPTLTSAWAVCHATQFNEIITPYTDATTLAALEAELTSRYDPQINLQGFAFTAVRGTQASCATLGTSRNSPHVSIIGAYDSPTNPEIWAAAYGAVCAAAMEADAGRPTQFLKLTGVLLPPVASQWGRSERDSLLYSGIATYVADSGNNVVLERSITTYRTNALGAPDPSYLDINQLFLIMAIRFQYNTRMINRFISQRFKLADDSFPVQPGSMVATPKTIKQEIVSLFADLQEIGYIENLQDFINNLVVERDLTDVNRVNVLLPVNLINQFRVLATTLQFIL